MNYLKLLPKNIPSKLTSNNVVYSLLILIIIISFLKKEHKLLSLFVIIQCSIFLIFSNKNKNVWMLIVNVLGLLCLFFLLMKNKEGIRKLGRSLEKSMLKNITRKENKIKQKFGVDYNCQTYLDRYSDLRNAFGSDCNNIQTRMKALDHFAKSGYKEGRYAGPKIGVPINSDSNMGGKVFKNTNKFAKSAAKIANKAEKRFKRESKINTELQKKINMQKELREKNKKLLEKKISHDNKVNKISNKINNLNNKKIKNMKASDKYEKAIKDIKGGRL